MCWRASLLLLVPVAVGCASGLGNRAFLLYVALAFAGGAILPRVDPEGLRIARWCGVLPVSCGPSLWFWLDTSDFGPDPALGAFPALAALAFFFAIGFYSAGAWLGHWWLQRRGVRIRSRSCGRRTPARPDRGWCAGDRRPAGESGCGASGDQEKPEEEARMTLVLGF